MAPSLRLQTNPVGLRQPNPPQGEGRKGYPLFGPNGPQISFLTGAEVFEWKSNSLGVGTPSAILGAWVDATGISDNTKQVTINFNNGYQVFDIQGGEQGYIVCTPQAGPVDVQITTNNGAACEVTVILYNYNPLFTGLEPGQAAAGAPPVGSQSGSGSGGTGGGGTGPVNPACFTGETRIKTLGGWRSLDSLSRTVEIENETGKWLAEVIRHDHRSEPVIMLPGGLGRVNLIHGIKHASGRYVEAQDVWPDAPREMFSGSLYNLHVLRSISGGEPTEDDAHYIVEPSIVAHNLRPVK